MVSARTVVYETHFSPSIPEALLGVLGIRDNRKNNYGDKG